MKNYTSLICQFNFSDYISNVQKYSAREIFLDEKKAGVTSDILCKFNLLNLLLDLLLSSLDLKREFLDEIARNLLNIILIKVDLN